MNHPIEQEELMAYLDGELALDRAAKAAAHLEKCRECQSLAGDLESVSRKLMALQVESRDDLRMSQAIGAALGERERTKEKPTARGRLGWREVLGIPRLPRWAFRGGLAIVVVGVMVVLFNSMFLTREFAPQYRMSETANTPAPQPRSGTIAGYVDTGTGAGTAGKLEVPQQLGVNKAKPEAEETQTTDGSVTLYGNNGATRKFPAQEAKPHATTPVGPMVVRKASLALITKDFDKSRAAMEETLKRHGGYIGQLTVSAPSENGRTLTATLRIPAGQLDAALAELKNLGRVADESQSGEEVTQQYVDLEARLANAKNSEQRLTDILRNRTGKLADVLEVEQAIEEVRGNIEQMEAERKNLAKQVDFATLSATLTEEYQGQLHAVPVSTFTRMWNAAVDGYGTVTESVVNVVLFLFSYGPVFLLWGAVLFFPARAIWRRLRKRMTAAN
jgi:hypothetical protein